MTGRPEDQGNPHGTPPGQDKDSPGLGKEDAPGQQKPRVDNELPDEGEEDAGEAPDAS